MSTTAHITPGLTRVAAAALLVAGVASAAAGCGGEAGGCQVIATTMLADPEKSPQGMSGAEVLALAIAHETGFTWRRTLDGDNPTNADPEAMVTVAVTVERGEGAVRHVVSEQQGSTEEDAGCGASLYVPIRLRVTTSDGALDDVFAGDLVFGAELPGVAWITATFAFDELAGGLRPTMAGASGEVQVEFADPPRGWIAVRHEVRDDVSVSETWALAGHWGPVAPPEQ